MDRSGRTLQKITDDALIVKLRYSWFPDSEPKMTFRRLIWRAYEQSKQERGEKGVPVGIIITCYETFQGFLFSSHSMLTNDFSGFEYAVKKPYINNNSTNARPYAQQQKSIMKSVKINYTSTTPARTMAVVQRTIDPSSGRHLNRQQVYNA